MRHPAAQPRPGRRGGGDGGLDDSERVPPGGSAEAREATMGMRDDGERSAISREQVAKRRSESNRVTGTVGSRVAS